MKVKVTDEAYIRAVAALLEPGEELPIDFKRFKSAYNVISNQYAWREPGGMTEFVSEADAIMFLLRFS